MTDIGGRCRLGYQSQSCMTVDGDRTRSLRTSRIGRRHASSMKEHRAVMVAMQTWEPAMTPSTHVIPLSPKSPRTALSCALRVDDGAPGARM